MRSIRAAAVGAVTMSLALAATACGGLLLGRRIQRLAEGTHLLGLQPGRQRRGRQEGPPARTRQVREGDRHQGEAGGGALVRPAEPDPHRHHLGTGPRRPEHRQHLERLLQATGALLPWDAKNFEKIGGRDRFVDSALGSTGVEGQDPAAVPLYSMAYALYYNKQMFADAGITKPRPPGTSWSRPAGRSPGTASGAWARRAPTCPTTSTRSSSSPSSTAPTSSPPTASPTSPPTEPSPPSSSTST